MKTFKEFITEERVDESYIRNVRKGVVKKYLKTDDIYSDDETENKASAYMKSEDCFKKTASILKKNFGARAVEYDMNKESFTVKFGNNSYIEMSDGSGYDLYMSCRFLSKKVDENKVNAFAKAIKELNLY